MESGASPPPLPDIFSVVERYALFNPHLRINARIGKERGRVWEPTDLTWKRWRPSDPLVAAWYDLDRFVRLFCAVLHADRKVGQIRLVRDWIADFRGLSGTAKRRDIMADLGLARANLEGLVKDGVPDRDKLERLLRAMQGAGTAPKAAALGIIGRDHMLERLQLGEMVSRASSIASSSTTTPCRRGSPRSPSPMTPRP